MIFSFVICLLFLVEKATSNTLPELISEAIKFPTVSGGDSNVFCTLRDWLESSFPILHGYEKVIVNESSVIYRPACKICSSHWLYYGHLDVVPVGKESEWTHPPFSGKIIDGFVHGRGAVDMKSHVISFLYALNKTQQSAVRNSSRCWTIALGHDEEIGGWNGARNIRKYLEEKMIGAGNDHFLFDGMIDEGLPALRNVVKLPQVRNKVLAMIGVAEKGNMNVKITAKNSGGHSSLGSWQDNPIIVLTNLLDKMTKKHPFPVHWDAQPTCDYLQKMLMVPESVRPNYRKLGFERVLTNALVKVAPILRPLLSSTMTLTGFASGSDGVNNVVPMEASAYLNIRIHPSDSVQSILDHLSQVIRKSNVSYNGPTFEIDLLEGSMEASPISPYRSNNANYELISSALKHVYQNSSILVLPALVIGATDTKHLIPLVRNNNAFRVTPFLFESKDDLALYHGRNERISITNINRLLEFYKYLLES